MKIINVEDFFHPDAGYQINLLAKYMVKLGHDVTILTGEPEKAPDDIKVFFDCANISEKDKIYSDKYGVTIKRIPLKHYISGRAFYDNVIFDCLKNNKPDVIFIHGNSSLFAMQYLIRRKENRVPIVMDCHMLEMASKNRFKFIFEIIYKHIFTPIIIREKIPVIRTQNDLYVQKCLGIPLEQCPWISVGTDTMLFRPDKTVRQVFRKEHGISDDAFVIMYAGKMDESKGGQLLAKALSKRFKTGKDVVAVIVGKTVGDYGKQIEDMFQNSEIRIIRMSTQKYENLANIYQASDLSLFPKQCSLSFYDVQACGLPVVFEDNEINIDRSKHDNAVVFKKGDVVSFREKIEELINMPDADYEQMRLNSIKFVQSDYNYMDITRRYLKEIEKAITIQKDYFKS